MTILLTGASGYIGNLVIEKLLTDPTVEKIICVDERKPFAMASANLEKNSARIQWIIVDLAHADWATNIPVSEKIDTVIHCAFKIRNPYGAAATKATEDNNLAACRNVFSFTFDRNIGKLIYLSSVAAYGAKPENIGKLLTEDAPIDEVENPYGYQKAMSEKILNDLFAEKKPSTHVFILRLNSITGPRGQAMASKFGLITFIKKLLPFVIEANPAWARQFVHESDLVEIIYILTNKGLPGAATNPTIFNIAPEKFLTASDMGLILNKIILPIPEWSVKPLFWIAWHGSHGKLPTRPDSAMGLIYPINVDGSKIKNIGFEYAHTAEDALLAKK